MRCATHFARTGAKQRATQCVSVHCRAAAQLANQQSAVCAQLKSARVERGGAVEVAQAAARIGLELLALLVVRLGLRIARANHDCCSKKVDAEVARIERGAMGFHPVIADKPEAAVLAP